MVSSRFRNIITLVLVAVLAALAVAGYYIIAAKASSSAGIKEAERFLDGILVAQYTRPVSPEAKQKLVAAYAPSINEAQHELSRILAELDRDQKAMENMNASFRDSKVRVRIRSLEIRENHVDLVAEVLADWYWGYDGKLLETPTQVYNLHEFTLTGDGNNLKVVRDRNLASSPKTEVKVAPLEWNN